MATVRLGHADLLLRDHDAAWRAIDRIGSGGCQTATGGQPYQPFGTGAAANCQNTNARTTPERIRNLLTSAITAADRFVDIFIVLTNLLVANRSAIHQEDEHPLL
jgi:hypothetical protein